MIRLIAVGVVGFVLGAATIVGTSAFAPSLTRSAMIMSHKAIGGDSSCVNSAVGCAPNGSPSADSH
jgi:purine-cytosine permease-like protein